MLRAPTELRFGLFYKAISKVMIIVVGGSGAVGKESSVAAGEDSSYRLTRRRRTQR
jgi:hypothetical protein